MQRAFGYRSEQRKRSENQDSLGVFEFQDFTLAIVCDGMGGHVGGAQASALAVQTVHGCIEELVQSNGPSVGLRVALERANQAIYEAARKNHRLMGMGTTAVAGVLSSDGFVHIAHVGDSRAYLINEGQAVQVTRDHTMVNLFVDAELLTPEDAATHPEAHVLSRSLGVERQVEVESSEPIELAANDVLFLCSDGVHGVVKDWELGSVDWAAPRPGIDHVLEIVEAREGDDNATAVAVLIADAPGMAPSSVPDPSTIEQAVAPSPSVDPRATLVPPEPEFEPADDPDSHRTEPSAPPRETVPAPAEVKPSGYVVEETPAPVKTPNAAPPEETRPDLRKKSSDDEGNRKLVLAGVGAVVLMALVGVGAVFALNGPSDTGTTGDAVIDNPQPDLTPAPPPKPGPVAPAQPEPEPEPETPETEAFFRADVPKAPRRLPHKALRFTQPPPAGQAQFKAVRSARDKKCAESLSTVMKAMGTSPDHAKLYSQAWQCFTNSHSTPLQGSTVKDFSEFGDLETHFRGWPPFGEDPIVWTAEEERLPLWYRPARDGIERRLEAWAASNDDDQLREVMIDLQGESSVADEFAADLLMEAQAAVALSKAPERTDDVTEAWARRVYIVSSALKGRVGRLLKTHRPELLPEIERLLDEAMTLGNATELPGDIAKAHKVGTGEEPPPTKVVKPVGPRPDPLGEEPDLGSDPTNGGTNTTDGPTKIYK